MANDLVTRLLLNSTQFDNNLTKSTKQVQKFQHDTERVSKGVTNAFSKLGGAIGKIAPALGIATTAYGAFNKVLDNSEVLTDKFNRAIDSAKGGVDMFFASISSGNWNNFLNNLNEAIKRSSELYDKLDALGSTKTNNSLAIARTKVEIAQLLNERKKGKDVQSQLDDAYARLEYLEGQIIDRGLDTAKEQFADALKRQYGDISDAFVESAWLALQTQGQDYFDAAAARIEELKKKGADWSTVNRLGGIIHYNRGGEFNIEKLTKEEQEEYKALEALINAEGSLSAAIQTANEALSEQQNLVTSERRVIESGGGSKSGRVTAAASSYTPFGLNAIDLIGGRSVSDIKASISKWEKAYNEAGTFLGRQMAKAQIEAYKKELANIDKTPAQIMLEENASNMNLSGIQNIQQNLITYQSEYNDLLSTTASLIGSIGDSFAATGNSTVESIGRMLQAVVPLISAMQGLALAEGVEKAASTSSTWYETIAAVASVTASILAALANISKFETGGIVGGTSYSGDRITARVNSGEMILNKQQQANLFNAINNGSIGGVNGGNVVFKIQGKELVGVLNNYNNKMSKMI